MGSELSRHTVETHSSFAGKIPLLFSMGGTLLVCVYAVIFNLLQFLPLTILIFVLGIWFVRDARVRFSVTVFAIILLKINQESNFAQYFAAFIFIAGILQTLIQKKIMEKTPLARNVMLLPFIVFLLWATLLGITGVITDSVTVEQFFRETLLWSPLFLLPIYFQEIIESSHNAEKFLERLLVVLWISVFLVSFMRIKQHLVQAAYLFEIGTSRYDTINGVFMMYIFLSLAMYFEKRRFPLIIICFFISVLSIILTFGRAAWVGGMIFSPIIVLLGDNKERKKGYHFILKSIIIGIAIIFLCYLFIPLVKVGLLYIISFLFTSGHLKTDPSLFNRYVEWDYLLSRISTSPLTGYGSGATFHNYDWLLGIYKEAAFTHNAYLGILFKTGVIGFILLFIPYIGFIVQGIRYCRNKILTSKERAYLRAGIGMILFVTFMGYTGNIFYQREMALYIALYWCICLDIEKKIKSRPSPPVTSLETAHVKY